MASSRSGSRLTGPCRAAIVCALLGARMLGAQVVAGRVIDSTKQTPIARGTVTLMSGRTVTASTRTNDSGRFEVRAKSAGDYELQFKLVGFAPRTEPVRLAAGETITRTVALVPLAATLDTITRRDSSLTLFSVTPGREVYQKHFARGIGQFVSGLEIQRSKLDDVENLGTAPGLSFNPAVIAACHLRVYTYGEDSSQACVPEAPT